MTLLRSVSLNFLLRIALGLLQVLTTVELTRMMSVENYGQLSMLILNAALFNMVTSLGIDSSLTYHYSAGLVSTRNAWRTIWIFILFQVTILLLWFLIRPLTPSAASLSLSNDGQVLLIMLALVVGTSLQDKYGALFNGSKRYSTHSITLTLAALACLITLWWYHLAGDHPQQRAGLLIYVCYPLLPAMVLVMIFHVRQDTAIDPGTGIRRAMMVLAPFSMVSYLTNSIQLLAYRIDYWILDHYHPGDPLGWYALAVRLSQILWFLPVVMSAIFFPEAARTMGMQPARLARAIRHLNALNLMLAALVILFSRPAIRYFFGADYMPAAELILILLPGILCFAITTLIASYMAGQNRLRVNLIGSSLCLVLVLILDLCLIPRWGAQGAALSSTVAYMCTTAYFIRAFRVRSGCTLGQLLLPTAWEFRQWPGSLKLLIKSTKLP